jgi:hypothetical protein
LAEQITKRSRQLEEILSKAVPRHEPEVEEAQGHKEFRLPSPMLDVRFRDGRIRSFNYAYLAEVSFVPGDTLTLRFSDGAVIIAEGRSLAKYRQQIRLHRADEICESTEAELELETEGLSQVEKISITEGDEV